jgi:hypothetical protein
MPRIDNRMNTAACSRRPWRLSAGLLWAGVATTAIAAELFTSYWSSKSDAVINIAFSLWFVGLTLMGAGWLCPFGRAVSGALSGFILAGLCIMNPIRSIGTNANVTFSSVAAELEAQRDAAAHHSEANGLIPSQ